MAGGEPRHKRRAALVLAAALVLVRPIAAATETIAEAPRGAPLAPFWSGASAGSPLLHLSIHAQTGYDNDLLADPDGVGILEPVSAWLAAVGPVLRARRAGIFSESHRDRCEGSVEGGISGYSENAIGSDWNGRGSLLYQVDLSSRVLVEGSTSFLRFRRRELPIFDIDLPEVWLQVARATRDHWLLAGELGYARPSYPGRALDPGGHQQDDRFEFTGSFLRTFSRRNYAALRAAWRDVDSNDPYVVQHGPLLEVRAGSMAVAGSKLVASVAFSERSYPDYPVLRATRLGPVDTGETRRDVVWQLALTAERALSARVSLYAQGMAVHQWSNVDALSFGEARGVVGLQVELWRAGSEDGRAAVRPVRPARLPPLAPVVRADGVLFRVRAPDAHRVALVGGFNGWDESASPMRGPDAAGVWEIAVPLPAGSWHYAFVVDGKWVRPEGAPRYEDNGLGQENGVLDLDDAAGAAGAP